MYVCTNCIWTSFLGNGNTTPKRPSHAAMYVWGICCAAISENETGLDNCSTPDTLVEITMRWQPSLLYYNDYVTPDAVPISVNTDKIPIAHLRELIIIWCIYTWWPTQYNYYPGIPTPLYKCEPSRRSYEMMAGYGRHVLLVVFLASSFQERLAGAVENSIFSCFSKKEPYPIRSVYAKRSQWRPTFGEYACCHVSVSWQHPLTSRRVHIRMFLLHRWHAHSWEWS